MLASLNLFYRVKPTLALQTDRLTATAELKKRKSLLIDVEVHEVENVGHFVQEELVDELCPLLEKHLEKIKA